MAAAGPIGSTTAREILERITESLGDAKAMVEHPKQVAILLL